MRNVLKYHSAKDPGKVDFPFEVRFDMNASRKRKNTKPKGFFEKLKEQRNQRKADRAKQTDRKTDILKKTGSGIVTLLLVILPPAVCFYLMECYSHNPFAVVRPWAQFFNIVLFELVTVFLFVLTGKLKAAHRIVYIAAMIYGIANSYVVRFRTNPIVPWDIFSWKTAASVADNYDFCSNRIISFYKSKSDTFGILETADSGSAGGCGSFIVCGNTAAGELSEQPQTLQ